MAGPRHAAKAARLTDPLGEHELTDAEVQALVDRLAKKGRVPRRELDVHREVPNEYLHERAEVLPKNRGLGTMYWRSGHLRRRYIDLLLNHNEDTAEGHFIIAKLKVYAEEIVILQGEITALGGRYWEIPEVLSDPVVISD